MIQDDERRLSRRGFLGTAIGGLAVAPFVSPSSASAQVPELRLPALPGKKLGWAIVGLGGLAVNQVLPAFAKCERSRVTALVSGRPAKVRHLAELYGVDARNIYDYDSFDRIASNPAIGPARRACATCAS